MRGCDTYDDVTVFVIEKGGHGCGRATCASARRVDANKNDAVMSSHHFPSPIPQSIELKLREAGHACAELLRECFLTSRVFREHAHL